MTPCERWPERRRRDPEARPAVGLERAYRVAWEQAHGPLASDLVLHHACGHRWCVNVEHLVPMTQAEHARHHGIVGGDWGQAAKTHCPAGHSYGGENLYVSPAGERHCKACRREAKRRYRERNS